MGLRTSGFYSLFAKFNKSKGQNNEDKKEGLIESLGELTLDKEDTDLIKLTKEWELLYDGSSTKKRIHEEGEVNQRYWIGRQFPDTEYENGKRPLTDNVIFEGFETLIPQATQQNPEPIVMIDGTPEMEDVKDKIRMSLKYLAEYNHLKTKLKKGVRHWGLRFIGCWQIGYNGEENEVIVKVINPKDLILDPHGWVEDGEYFGEFIGLKLNDTAQNLITRFPEHKDKIEKLCENKLGSLMGYTQWWTDEFVVYKFKEVILQKSKNPHWNYDKEVESVDETGQPIKTIQSGQNHLPRPKMPFVFLTVFDLGDEPCDKTGLISQGLVTQDNINKRLKQIDRNVDNINGGVVVNGLMFNKEQSAQVAAARREGRTIVTPGRPEEAIMFPNNANLPDSLYESLNDQRRRFLERFGAAGSTASSTEQEQTVRGKIIKGQQDTSRTGGGVSEYLELVAAKIFDYWVQMIYVYWDTPHWISVIGENNALQVAQFKASDIPVGHKLSISIQNGSMVPQDELSIYNEAMSLWEGGALDPLSLFEKLKDSNPQERSERLMVYKTNPALYMQQYLSVQSPLPVQSIPQGGGGSESGAPPNSVPPPATVPTAVQTAESQLLNKIPIK